MPLPRPITSPVRSSGRATIADDCCDDELECARTAANQRWLESRLSEIATTCLSEPLRV